MIGTQDHQALFDRLAQLVAMFPSQAAFAAAVGIEKQAVSDWKLRVRQPRAFTLMKICAALDVDANWLLLGRGAPSALDRTRIVGFEALRAFNAALREFEAGLAHAGGESHA